MPGHNFVSILAILVIFLVFGGLFLLYSIGPSTGLASLKTNQENPGQDNPSGLAVLPGTANIACSNLVDFELISLPSDNAEEFVFRNRLEKKFFLHKVAFGKGFAGLKLFSGEKDLNLSIAPFEEFSIPVSGQIDKTQAGLLVFVYTEDGSTVFNIDQLDCFGNG